MKAASYDAYAIVRLNENNELIEIMEVSHDKAYIEDKISYYKDDRPDLPGTYNILKTYYIQIYER